MAFRYLTRNLFQLAKRTTINQRLYSSIQNSTQHYRKFQITQGFLPIRTFSSVQTNDNAYRDLDTFLQKEIQLEKSAQKHPSKLPTIPNFQVIFLKKIFSFETLFILFRSKQVVQK